MWVRIPPWTQMKKKLLRDSDKSLVSYIVGVAIGDGNLSNPNGRATRLRVYCDLKYPKLIQKIQSTISTIFPENKVSLTKGRGNYLSISCYSNHWEKLLGWHAADGSKFIQDVSIPDWIKKNEIYKINCLRGLIETDGSIYNDRGYKMVMFTNATYRLASDVFNIIESLNFKPHIYKVKNGKGGIIYRVRLAKKVEQFLELVKPEKL